MSALLLNIHYQTPELRKIRKVVEVLREGGVILYPTDTGFTLGCELSNKYAIQKLRSIRKMSPKQSLTFMTQSLSDLSEFARVSNPAYRVIRGLIPGPFTFILQASKLVPKLAQNPNRKTAGIRVPDNILTQLLLKELDAPIISISAKKDGVYIDDPYDMIDAFKKIVDCAVYSDEYYFTGPSTIIDMTTDEFTILREGAAIELANEFI